MPRALLVIIATVVFAALPSPPAVALSVDSILEPGAVNPSGVKPFGLNAQRFYEDPEMNEYPAGRALGLFGACNAAAAQRPQ